MRYQPPPTSEQRAQSQLDERINEYRMALLEAVGGLQKAVTLLTRAECIEGVNIRQLSEWLNQFNPEMCLFDEVRQGLIAMVDIHPLNTFRPGEQGYSLLQATDRFQ